MTQRRTGFTLIEMLAAMAVASVLMTLATLTIALLIRSERTGGESLVAAQAGQRFERRFRNDVHTATAATVDTKTPGRPLLTLTAEKQPTITWTQVEGGFRRTVASQPSHVDTFRLSASNILFSLESTGPPRRRQVPVAAQDGRVLRRTLLPGAGGGHAVGRDARRRPAGD